MPNVVRWKLGRMGVVIAALVMAAAGPAGADPWGTATSDTGAHPDSNPHTYCFSSVPSSSLQADIHAMEDNALGGPTQANVSFGGCDFSSASETDVVWFAGDLPGTTRGQTYCENYETYCDQFYATIDENYIVQNSSFPADNVRKTICHELGHSAGLTHGPDYGGCMVSGPVNGSTAFRRYSSHHIGHINSWFN